jgi:DNA-binding NarL/FixJ family response regulator
MKPHILIVEPERELRAWLRHHMEILWPDGRVEDIETPQFEARLESPNWDLRMLDLIVLGANCGEGGAEVGTGLDLLRVTQRRARMPPIVIIATGGNELSAVRALRIGAADYLPRSLLSAQRLATCLRLCLNLPRRRPLQPAQPARPAGDARRRIDPAHLELPQYSILHKLGESGRAVVYLAHSVSLGQNVALKISKPALESADDSQEFAREYAAICALNHPSVVSIYDYGFHAGREFLAMEYFPCGDLKTRLLQPITVLESLQFALRICDALQVVHRAGLVHRDLKPPNVMLREDGSIVLIDFGLAKQLDGGQQHTAVGVLRGSPYYMSPEQAKGLTLDARSDLYSTGVIFYEMLTGSKPYLGSSAVEVMEQHVNGRRAPLPPSCAALEPLLDRLMARDRDARFADAASASAAIRTAVERIAPRELPLAAAGAA